MLARNDVEVQGFPPDPTTLALTNLACDALRVHLRWELDRRLGLGFDGQEAVDLWRTYWGDVLNSLIEEAGR